MRGDHSKLSVFKNHTRFQAIIYGRAFKEPAPARGPTQALEPLIRAFCQPDGIVLDPFCGSGSTLVVARTAGRRFIGVTLDGEWTGGNYLFLRYRFTSSERD